MFTGEMMDANGLAYMRARYYDPMLGVFPSLDPIENNNRYLYVNANPINRTDPTGMFGWGSFVTEPGDYCYCIGREGGVPDGLLENFAIWLKNNNPAGTFMPDSPGQKYWLYPEKPLMIPNSFMDVDNIHDTGLWKRNGCHCPESIKNRRCDASTNPVSRIPIESCKCPEGQVWDPILQHCLTLHPCPAGGFRYPGGACPGFDWSQNFPPGPNPGLGPSTAGTTSGFSNLNCTGQNLSRPMNQKIWGIVTDLSGYFVVGGGVSVYIMTDGNETAIYGSGEIGYGLSFDFGFLFSDVLLTYLTEKVIPGWDEPYNVFSESDLDGFATNLTQGFSKGFRMNALIDVARTFDANCAITEIRGVDLALGLTSSFSGTVDLTLRIPGSF